MSIPDIINGTFEFLGGLFILNHCLTLYRDKLLKGVSILSTVFFFLWGIWNIWYYPSLDQWFSFYGGVFLASTNCLWISMMVYYTRKEKKNLMV